MQDRFITLKRQALLLKEDEIIIGKGHRLYKISKGKKNLVYYASFTANLLDRILSKSFLISKVLRLGFHYIIELSNQEIIGVLKGKIVFLEKGSNKFKTVFKIPRGSRPLNICKDSKNNFYFGEYFDNPDRDEVNIYYSSDGVNWDVIYTFPPKSIRHIHNIVYDEYYKRFLILTGDKDNECGIYETIDFKELNPVLQGSQKVRAVSVIPMKRGLIIPTDTPNERNHIRIYDYKTNTLNTLKKVEGSVFHAKKVDDIYLISTVVEPSAINLTKWVKLYGSIDGTNWKELFKYRKQSIPQSLLKYFRYPEIIIMDGLYDAKIGLYCRSLKRLDNTTLFYDKEYIKRIISA